MLDEIYWLVVIIDFQNRLRPILVIYYLNSREITISLSVEKMAKISAFAADLLTRKVCPICDVTRISGLIVSSFRAVLPSKLHYRALERLKIASLEKKYNNNYDRSVFLTACRSTFRSTLSVVNVTNENGVFLQKLQDIVSIELLNMTSQPPCWCFNSK